MNGGVPAKASRLRFTPFRHGLLWGGGLTVTMLALIVIGIRWLFQHADVVVALEASGAALTKHGAQRVEFLGVIPDAPPMLRQSCNGACDDLSFRLFDASEGDHGVDVRSAKGDCLDCGARAYTDAFNVFSTRFVIRDDGGPLVDLE